MDKAHAKSGMTISDLEGKIEEAGGLYDAVYNDDHPICDDVRKHVNVDFENLEYAIEYNLPGAEDLDQFEMVGPKDAKFPVAWVTVGGDWEKPLVFAIYIDQDGVLRGYVPEDGNGYNHDFNCAYGSEPTSGDFVDLDEDGEYDPDKEEPDCDDVWTFDADAMREEVGTEITAVP